LVLLGDLGETTRETVSINQTIPLYVPDRLASFSHVTTPIGRFLALVINTAKIHDSTQRFTQSVPKTDA
jgi:hypothetical protein